MKKMLIVINNFNDVSHNQHLLRLIKFLSKKRDVIALASLTDNGELKTKFDSVPKVTRVKIQDVFHFLKENPETIILTKELRSEYFVFIVRFFLGWSKYKHLTIRPSFGFLNESWWKIIKNILFYFSLFLVDLNITVGETVANRIRAIKNVKKQKVVCIPNSLSKKFLASNTHHLLDIKKINFIYTGFLEKRKNLDYSIELLELVPNNFTFTILGDGPEKNKLINLVKTKKMTDKVNFLGHVANVKEHLGKADIFLFLTKMEGLSLSLLEAMACGLVCVVSDIPENRELIIDMKNGLILPLNNQKQAIKKLANILKNEKQLIKMGKNARQTIIEKYSDDKSFRLYEQILNSI